jgi:integrase
MKPKGWEGSWATAQWKAGDLGTRVFRHTFTAARLQTLDRGAPVSLYTVSRKLGHGSEEMVRRVNAHLGSVRHRSQVVEFRVEQHEKALKDRLGARVCYPEPYPRRAGYRKQRTRQQ